MTLVSGRTVGIGAYLARLGRRCVQRTDQPIILTGWVSVCACVYVCVRLRVYVRVRVCVCMAFTIAGKAAGLVRDFHGLLYL